MPAKMFKCVICGEEVSKRKSSAYKDGRACKTHDEVQGMNQEKENMRKEKIQKEKSRELDASISFSMLILTAKSEMSVIKTLRPDMEALAAYRLKNGFQNMFKPKGFPRHCTKPEMDLYEKRWKELTEAIQEAKPMTHKDMADSITMALMMERRAKSGESEVADG